MGEVKITWGSNILLALLSFHFYRNIQHPEKWGVSFNNFSLKSLRKTSLFVFFELLPTGLLKYVWPPLVNS